MRRGPQSPHTPHAPLTLLTPLVSSRCPRAPRSLAALACRPCTHRRCNNNKTTKQRRQRARSEFAAAPAGCFDAACGARLREAVLEPCAQMGGTAMVEKFLKREASPAAYARAHGLA